MTPRLVPPLPPAQVVTGNFGAAPETGWQAAGAALFSAHLAAMASQPLHELGPADPGAEPAAIGFALCLAAAWAGKSGTIWAGEEGVFAEDGAPYPPGLAQFGLDPAGLIVVRAGKREECLWAAEQALSARGAVVVCALGARGKPLDLKATRRLLLFAERNGSKCLLVRPLADASAAWTRWRVSPAPSEAEERELGPPAYKLELIRNRAGPAGARFTIEWNAHARAFRERDVARDRSAASFDGPADPIRARAR
ncbi:MAG TPA: hypothetical protein VEA80_17180 [Vitreimonas sp.]|uniref:ImuA family protein n=1 Tax=Vitreimonas sp. TaxID=3069702 RepID=UPI002D5FCDBA|nr:hypothetical protein [Vitreimonas sp.]HYD89215.1 hypothetical protein [Vitreimonas sp.]